MLCGDVLENILHHVTILGDRATILSVLQTCKWMHDRLVKNPRFQRLKQTAARDRLRRLPYRPDRHNLFHILKCRQGEEDELDDGIRVFAVFPEWAWAARKLAPKAQRARNCRPTVVEKGGWTLVSSRKGPRPRPSVASRRRLVYRPPPPEIEQKWLPVVPADQIYIFLVFPYPYNSGWSDRKSVAALYSWDWVGTAEELYELLRPEFSSRPPRLRVPERAKGSRDWEERYRQFVESFLLWYEDGRVMPPVSYATYTYVETIRFRNWRNEEDTADDPGEDPPLWAQRKGHAFFYW